MLCKANIVTFISFIIVIFLGCSEIKNGSSIGTGQKDTTSTIEEKTPIEDLKKIYSDDIKKNDPLKIVNMIGVDTCLDILINLNSFDKSFYVPNCLQVAVKNNILGYKNKKIFKV